MADVRVFVDSSVLIRYFAEDDIPRAAAAAELLDGAATLVISTGVILEALHVLRTEYQFQNPTLAELLVRLLTHNRVELTDAPRFALAHAVAATRDRSARRISDAILAVAAQTGRCTYIATFDEGFVSLEVPVRLL